MTTTAIKAPPEIRDSVTDSPIDSLTPRAPEAPDPFVLLATRPPVGSRLRMVQAIPSAVAALRANKGRSLLTTLGMVIGVAAVISIVALGQGASASVSNQLQGLGLNILTISPGSTQGAGPRSGAGGVTTLSAADADAIGAQVPLVTAVSPVLTGNFQLIAGRQNWQTRVLAVRPAYQQLQDWHMAQGTFFTNQDTSSAASVVVLGKSVVSNLYPSGQSPVGQVLLIGSSPFKVVGVLADKGTGQGPDQADVVFVPFQTGQVRLFGRAPVNQVLVQTQSASQLASVSQAVQQVLRSQHRLRSGQADDFTIGNNNDAITRAQGVSQTLTLLLGCVAAVSLVVGGIGIMNIMLVSVTERTREIGIRLAIGAQPADIMSQFLIEAVVLSVLGGVLGIVLGASVALLLPILAGWATALPWPAIGLAFGFSALIGVFFGMYPARKAAQLDPIVALRYE